MTENRIQKLDEAILEERAKIADIEHVSLVYLYQVIINLYIKVNKIKMHVGHTGHRMLQNQR